MKLLYSICGILLVGLIYVVGANGEIFSSFQASREPCAKETGYKGRFYEINNSTKEGKCFMKCILMKDGFMNEDGKLELKKINAEIEKRVKNPERKEKWLKVMEECSKVTPNKDLCEAAFQYYECKRTKMPRRP